MEPLGCRVIIHEPASNRRSWDFHAIEGFYVGPALHHYRNFTVFPSKPQAIRVSDTVKFRHAYITVPEIKPEDRVIEAIAKLKAEITTLPATNASNQIQAIEKFRELFTKYCGKEPDYLQPEHTQRYEEESMNKLKATTDPPRVGNIAAMSIEAIDIILRKAQINSK